MAKYDPDEFFDRKKPTNADRIRQMSDEDMAVFFNEDFLCPPGYATADGMLLTDKCVYHNDSDDEPCSRCWLDWLKQEVDK